MPDLSPEGAARTLGVLWIAAAHQSSEPAISMCWIDDFGTMVCSTEMLNALDRCDLGCVLRRAIEIGRTGDWHALWLELRSVFNLPIAAS